LWSEFREPFRRVEEHPPLDAVVERFGVKHVAIRPSIQLRMLEALPAPRCWFLNEAGSELIQVQADRFIHNWRKTAADQQYPRYHRLRQSFEQELGRLRGFLQREGLGDLVANQCEVTYVNHILAGKGWREFGELGQVLTVCDARYSDKFLGAPEDVRTALRYIIRNGQGEPTGRLHIVVEPAFRLSDGQPMLVMSLTARNRPEGEGVGGVLKALDIGREWVVRGFASITTPAMHGIWGRKDANRDS
jgi:uncharacterized protein (TIGR04255 family)